MWEHLNRQGITVAKCTVERLMRAHGWRGVTRGRAVRTTIPDPGHSRAPDLVRRNFTAGRPGQLHVADFMYVPLDGGGFGYTAGPGHRSAAVRSGLWLTWRRSAPGCTGTTPPG